MKKVLLYSGGMDSWLISKLWNPDIKIYINIHGKYSEEEIERLPEDVLIFDAPFLGRFELPNKHIPMRNLYFIMIASHFGNSVCLGATSGDGGKDKSLEFLFATEKMLSNLWDEKKLSKRFEVVNFFAQCDKGQLVKDYLEIGGNLNAVRDETFSCYEPIDGKECFNCYPCFRKFAILYACGCEYSQEVKQKMWDYVERKIIPTKEEGGYEGTYYTDRGKESVYLILAVEKLKKEMGGK